MDNNVTYIQLANPETATPTGNAPCYDAAVNNPTDMEVEPISDTTANTDTAPAAGDTTPGMSPVLESTCNAPAVIPACAAAAAPVIGSVISLPAMAAFEQQMPDKWLAANIKEWVKDPPPELDFLFSDVFPVGIVSLLCGAGGLGKSTLILQVAMSLASGKTLFMKFVPPKARKVVIFVGEDLMEITWARVHNCCKKFGFSEREKALLYENLKVYCVPARPLCMLRDGKVMTTEAFDKMKREIDHHRPELLVLDPKSRWSGLNENSNDEATTFIMKLEELVSPYKGSVLMTHHVSKSGKDSLKSSASRGASAFIDGARLVFSIAGDESAEKSNILLSVSKSNMTSGFKKNVRFRHLAEFGGILEQLQDPDDREQLFKIAEFLRNWLANTGPMNQSTILNPKTEQSKELHEAVEKLFIKGAKHLAQAIEVGVEEKFLEINSVGTRGRPAKQVCAVPIAAETKDDELETSDHESDAAPAGVEPATAPVDDDICAQSMAENAAVPVPETVPAADVNPECGGDSALNGDTAEDSFENDASEMEMPAAAAHSDDNGQANMNNAIELGQAAAREHASIQHEEENAQIHTGTEAAAVPDGTAGRPAIS